MAPREVFRAPEGLADSAPVYAYYEDGTMEMVSYLGAEVDPEIDSHWQWRLIDGVIFVRNSTKDKWVPDAGNVQDTYRALLAKLIME